MILRRADQLSAPAFVFGQDFSGRQEHGRMVYEDELGLLDLPLPKLIGRHQIENAAVAIAGLRHARGNASWGAGRGRGAGPAHRGLAGAAATADAMARWSTRRPTVRRSGWMAGTIRIAPPPSRRAIADLEEHSERPLYLICGMLRTKDAVGFLQAFRGLARHVVTVAIPGEAASLGAGALI